MFNRRLFVVLSFVLLAALLLTGLASAKTTITLFNGTEYFLGESDPLRAWPAGKSFHVRGVAGEYEEVASDPRVSGVNNTLLNINFHPPTVDGVVGQLWGTFVLSSDSYDGQWIGTFTGKMYFDGRFMYDAKGNGDGEFVGLKVRLHAEGDGQNPTTFEGYILDPGG